MMTTGKFKLSETIKFFSSQIQALSGHQPLSISLELDSPSVHAGGRVSARIVLKNPERARQLNYLTILMEGTIQRDDKWRAYTENAEVAQNTSLAVDQALIIPVQLYIPEDAVLTEDGARWSLSVRAVLDKELDPRGELIFDVLEPLDGQEDGRWFVGGEEE